MKITDIAFVVLGASLACAAGCAAPVDQDGADESSASSEAALSGLPHFNFAASTLMSPGGPAYFTQIRPAGSEMPDIMFPGPTYTATDRIIDADGKTFSGSAGSCTGKYAKTSTGRIVVKCVTKIDVHSCSAPVPVPPIL